MAGEAEDTYALPRRFRTERHHKHDLLLPLARPAASTAAAALLAAAHRRRWCLIGPSELGLSIQRARRSFQARRRRRRCALASLATAARNSSEVKLAAVAAETPEACSPQRDWLRGGTEELEGGAAVL
jgi:hypothetical protein